jgi:hypothetical protein
MSADRSSPGLRQADRILARFPSATAKLLVEFNKYISALDADHTVFMARKALRLHDLLVLAGGRPCVRPILSNHIFDGNLEIFRGKRVALVDDTLILGTTLGRAKKQLLNAGVQSVSTHVFCVDAQHWCRELIHPDKIFVYLQHDAMLTFCSAEVGAFSSVALPYLTDFPISLAVKLNSIDLALLQNIQNWEVFSLTTPSQEHDGVTLFSLLPKAEVIGEFEAKIPFARDLIDIVKIRVFIRKAGNYHWAKFVPILTLRPIEQSQVHQLLELVLLRLGLSGKQSLPLSKFLVTPIGKLRLIQYCLSAILGSMLSLHLSSALQSTSTIEFDVGEACRHYGPWSNNDIELLHTAAATIASLELPNVMDGVMFSEASLPTQVVATNADEIDTFIKSDAGDTAAMSQSMLTNLMQIFLEFYRTHELAARREVQQYKDRIYEVDASQAPHRDRLNYGFAWRLLARKLLGSERSLTDRRLSILSLALDQLIDLGIAVPILCVREGVLFRAYRHGEDVLFGDQEIALAYEISAGYVDAIGRESIPRVQLEKLLVSLIRVGAAKDMLTVVHGISGYEGVARIGFHLHGAIAIKPKEDVFVADERNSWLSQYLIDRGVLKTAQTSEYSLGVKPDAAMKRPGVDLEARQLGLLLGRLFVAKEKNQRIFDQNDFIILSTCTNPRDAAAAIAAELRLFERWFSRDVREILEHLDWNSLPSIDAAYKRIATGYGLTALHSAKMKFIAYKNGAAETIAAKCAKHLEQLPNGDFMSLQWRGFWGPVLSETSEAQFARFDPWISRLGMELFNAACGAFCIQLGLCTRLDMIEQTETAEARLNAAQVSVQRFIADLEKIVEITDTQMRIGDKVRTPIDDPKSAIDEGRRWISGNLVSISATARQVFEVVHDFGRMEHRVNYSQALWFDIIDSSGQRSKLTGPQKKRHRDAVRNFGRQLSRDFYGLTKEAARQGAHIHAWQGALLAKDDERHLFFTGTRNLSWLRQAILTLFRLAADHEISVRAIAISANFAGLAAHRYKNEVNVQGEQFWQHLELVKSRLRAFERTQIGSTLWIGGRLRKQLELDSAIEWLDASTQTIKTEAEDYPITTTFFGGRAKEVKGDL